MKRKQYRFNKKRKFFRRHSSSCSSSPDRQEGEEILDTTCTHDELTHSTSHDAESDSSSVHVGLGPYDVLMEV